MAVDRLKRLFGSGDLADGETLEVLMDAASYIARRSQLETAFNGQSLVEPNIVDKPVDLSSLVKNCLAEIAGHVHWGIYGNFYKLASNVHAKFPDGPQTFSEDKIKYEVYEIRRNYDVEHSKDTYKDSMLVISSFDEDSHEQLWHLGSFYGPPARDRNPEEWTNFLESIVEAKTTAVYDLLRTIAPEFGASIG